jgi:TDG/mug DNA glycosylase family protein
MTRPTRADLLAAADKRVPDVIAPGLTVLFCGINPGLYSAATGHHFARPGNRFWPTLHAAGFTDRLFDPSEERELLSSGLGITNVVDRASAVADELSADEIVAGGKKLRARVKRYRPAWLAVLGVGAYRVAFASPKTAVGPQSAMVGETRVWVLPNPSGLNAHYSREALARVFREFREAATAATGRPGPGRPGPG